MADFLDGILINALMADNDGAGGFDTDLDGTGNSADEFVRIENTTGTAISLDGYEIWSETNGLLYSFGATDTIGAGEMATVVGNYTGTPPAGFYDAGIPESGNFLPDGEGANNDAIFLVNSTTGEYVYVAYGFPPQAPTLPPGFPGTTRIGSGEGILTEAPERAIFVRGSDDEFVEIIPDAGSTEIPCFGSGTRITTKNGSVPIDNLEPGTMILTKDNGYVPLRAVRSTFVSRNTIARNPDLAPIVFPTGSIGNSNPLLMSASHRILIDNAWSSLLFSDDGVLVPATSTVGFNDIYQSDSVQSVVYFHLLFDAHEIIQAENCWVESLYLGDMVRSSVNAFARWRGLARTEILKLDHNSTARPILKGFEAQVLFAADPTVEVSMITLAA